MMTASSEIENHLRRGREDSPLHRGGEHRRRRGMRGISSVRGRESVTGKENGIGRGNANENVIVRWNESENEIGIGTGVVDLHRLHRSLLGETSVFRRHRWDRDLDRRWLLHWRGMRRGCQSRWCGSWATYHVQGCLTVSLLSWERDPVQSADGTRIYYSRTDLQARRPDGCSRSSQYPSLRPRFGPGSRSRRLWCTKG